MDKSDPAVLVYLRYSSAEAWQLQGKTGGCFGQWTLASV